MSAEARRRTSVNEDVSAQEVDRLVSNNLGLVYETARKLDRSGGVGPERGDLIGAGVQGLIQAAHAFDPDRGLAFSTLAVTRIRGAMIDEMRRWDQTPRSVRRKEREVKACETELRASLGRQPTPVEVADALSIDVEELHAWYLDMTKHVATSFDQGVAGTDAEGGGRSLTEAIPDDGPDPMAALDRDQSLEALKACLGALPPRDSKVLALYYYEGLRLREIAQLLGVTESRVSQIRHAALKTLRSLLADQGVDP